MELDLLRRRTLDVGALEERGNGWITQRDGWGGMVAFSPVAADSCHSDLFRDRMSQCATA